MTDYYKGSTGGPVTVSVTEAPPDECVPECINKVQWDCDENGVLYNTGDPCVPVSNDMLLLAGLALVGLVGAVALVGTGKKRG